MSGFVLRNLSGGGPDINAEVVTVDGEMRSRIETQAWEEERRQTTIQMIRWYKSLRRDEVNQKDCKQTDV
jgi:hypothetical protein